MRKTWLVALLALVALAIAVPTRADTTWTLTGVTFADGGTASGTFTLDDAGDVVAFDITTTAGTSDASTFPGYTYTTTSPLTGSVAFYATATSPSGSGLGLGGSVCAPISCIAFGVPGVSGYPVAPALTLYIDAAYLPNAVSGGPTLDVDICTTSGPCSGEPSNEQVGVNTRDVDPGYLVGTYVPSAVPEPSSLLLLACGLVGVGLLGRKKLLRGQASEAV